MNPQIILGMDHFRASNSKKQFSYIPSPVVKTRKQNLNFGENSERLIQMHTHVFPRFDRIRMKKIVAEESPEDSDPLTRQTRGNSL